MIVVRLSLPGSPRYNLVHEIARGPIRDKWTPQRQTHFHTKNACLRGSLSTTLRVGCGGGLE
jgi:hypothetical protein